jgi:hypothetical protein
MAEGRRKPQILRCVKRYIAQEILKLPQLYVLAGTQLHRLNRHRSINAVVEGFHERVPWTIIPELFEFIKISTTYYRRRCHSTLGYHSLVDYKAELVHAS